jgi:hypothetical protein
MPKFVPKTTDDAEPVGGDHFNWTPWALERIRECLRAGAEPPGFKHPSPWAWIDLHGVVHRDPELRDSVTVDFHAHRVAWRQPQEGDGDAPEA